MQPDSVISRAADLMLDARLNYRDAEDLLRRFLFRRALDRAAGNICHAAALVGIHRNHFTRELDRLQMRDLPRQISERRAQLELWRKSPARSRKRISNAIAA